AASETQVAHQQRRWRGGAAAEALQTHSDLDEGRGQGQSRLHVRLEPADRFQVHAVRVREAVRPQAFQAVELTVDDLGSRAQFTGSIRLPASWRKADRARTQDS